MTFDDCCPKSVAAEAASNLSVINSTSSIKKVDKTIESGNKCNNRKTDSTTANCCNHTEGLTILGKYIRTDFVASSDLPTKEGVFEFRAYRSYGELNSAEPVVLISSLPSDKKDIPCRVHDQCLTSEVFGSLKCDCKEQLDYAKRFINANDDGGLIIYMPQEGRGIGLANKVRAYELQQHQGVDTVDANRLLGFKDDYRTYEAVKDILLDLKIESIKLMTNNPRKLRALSSLGINITERIPIVMSAGDHNKGYLKAKEHRMEHHFGDDDLPRHVFDFNK